MRPALGLFKMSTSSSDVFKFTMLNRKNYTVWAVHMEDTLLSKYLWMVINGTKPCPAIPVAKEGEPFSNTELVQLQRVQDWIVKDKVARGIIRNSCDVSQ